MLEITDIPTDGYQSVKRAVDTATGLHAIISVHSQVLGPALGGMRLWPYANEADALFDVLRLSKGMTYKAACAGLDLGGGKSVIIGDPANKTEDLFKSMGEFVESFGGSYITAEDVNTKVEDMAAVNTKTQHVVGLAGKSGNPSPYTAWGCFIGLKACMEEAFGSNDLTDKVVAIEGVGSVGSAYARLIAEAGGKIVVADILDKVAQDVAAECDGIIVSPDAIRSVECDVYAPCALGGSINDDTLPYIKARVVCGAANNQLLVEDAHGAALKQAGILYGPDYVVNAGGLINVYNELNPAGYDEQRALSMMDKIHDNLQVMFAISNEEGICVASAAKRYGDRRIEAVGADAVN
ncbi:MAG: leucine dehydrogenase [Planctomycetota bacterium]|nr:MAG: leucine dehydrogenase [Planctomycetota bacterium]